MILFKVQRAGKTILLKSEEWYPGRGWDALLREPSIRSFKSAGNVLLLDMGAEYTGVLSLGKIHWAGHLCQGTFCYVYYT